MSSAADLRLLETDAEPVALATLAEWVPRALDIGRPGELQLRSRRALNVLVAAVLLFLVAPLMLLIALMIHLTSRGPVIYRQTRVGIDRRWAESQARLDRRRVDYGGRLFVMYKFRTMVWDPDNTLQLWARRGDPRVTPLGAVLRRYRLDELPQLVNVILGDMNLVGPRPEQPRLFQELREQVPGYAYRQRVLPGITGWAQINQGYDGCLADVRRKVRLDLEYIRRQSVWTDLVILLRTLPVMVFQRGAV